MTCIRHIFLKRAFMASMLLWASIVVTPAMAASIQYSFTGNVDNVHNQLSSTFNTTQSMEGLMTVNTSDTNGSGTFGNFAIETFTVTIGGYTATWGMGTSGLVEIRNGPGNAAGADRFNVTVTAPSGGNVNFLGPRIFDIQLRGPNSIFSSDALPTTSPSIASFTNRNLWRLVFGPGNGHVVRGDITSMTVVPLPAAVILFGAGLVALVGLGAGSWRQKKNSFA